MEGRDLRRSMTLSEQLAVEDSPNPLTAATGVAGKKEAFTAGRGPGSVSHRTLMDIIKEEHDTNGGAGAGINWKSLKERLRLRRARSGAAWVTPSPHSCPISDPEVVVSVRPDPAATLGRSISRSASLRNPGIPLRVSASRRGAIVSEYKPPAAARGTEEEEKLDSPASGSNAGGAEEGEGCEASNRAGGSEAEAAAAGEQPVRISLMALLEQTDRWVGEGEWEAAEEEEGEVAEDDDDEEGDGGGMYHVCCVCMVRHKGAAFIPCGHTFCRLCSRELWVSRGNCPLCNGFILEILDIF